MRVAPQGRFHRGEGVPSNYAEAIRQTGSIEWMGFVDALANSIVVTVLVVVGTVPRGASVSAAGDVVVLANPTGTNTSPTWWRDPAADATGFKAYKSTDGTNVTTVLVADAVQVGTQMSATSGSNTFVSGPGNDTIQGGSGVDQLDLTSRLDSSGQMVTVSGGLQVDLAQGTLTDTVVGGFASVTWF